MRNIYILFFYFALSACSNGTKDNEEKFFEGKIHSVKNVTIDSIKVETLNFETVESSFDGILSVGGNTINFIDRRFGWFFSFNNEGKLVSKKLGQGPGPSEINTGFIDAYAQLPNGKHIFIGSGYDVHIHDENFEREKTIFMQWYLKNKDSEITPDNLDPDMHRLYSPNYNNFNLQPLSDNLIYFPLDANHKFFNRFSTKKYYEESRIIGELNLETKKVESLEGRKSREYLKHNYLTAYDVFDYQYSLKDEKTYVIFQPDSLVYVYNKKFKNLYSFGNKGKYIGNTSYVDFKGGYDIKEYRKYLVEKKSKTGYYTFIKYFEEDDLLFRTYNIANSEINDGLQIYKGNTLIADVRVPNNFKVIGKIGDYYYSDVVTNEEENYFKCYKFKLENVK